MERLGIGVTVRAGRGQELNVIRQDGSSSIRLPDVGEAATDESLSCSKGAEDVQGVVTGLQTCQTRHRGEAELTTKLAHQSRKHLRKDVRSLPAAYFEIS